MRGESGGDGGRKKRSGRIKMATRKGGRGVTIGTGKRSRGESEKDGGEIRVRRRRSALGSLLRRG